MRPSPTHNDSIHVALLLTGLLAWSAQPTAAAEPKELTVGLQITSSLTFPNTPMSVTIDFADLIRQRRITGVLDSNSIRVINSASGQAVRSAPVGPNRGLCLLGPRPDRVGRRQS